MSVDSGPAPLDVTFTIPPKFLTSEEGKIIAYTIDYGDGGVYGVGTLLSINHTYTEPGDYTARISARECSGTSSFETTVCNEGDTVASFLIKVQ